MLTLLAPAALAGMVLLAIPILVHLFKPRRVRVTPFSSLRWLRLTQHKLSRKIQLHQLLLFLLRAAFVALLVLALARPVFKPPGVRSAAERFVVLDVSRSMGTQPETEQAPFELAKEIAARLTTGGLGDDRTSVLLAASTARALGPLTRDPEHYLGTLRQTQVTDADTRLTSALPLISAMLTQRRPNADVEVYFVTDNHRNIWSDADILEFEKSMTNSVRLRMIDVGAGGVANAWIAGARLQQEHDGAMLILHVKLAASSAKSQSRTLRLTGLQGEAGPTRSVTIEPGTPLEVKLDLPAMRDTQDGIVRLTLEPTDALASDDEYHVDLTMRTGLRILVIEGQATEVEQLRPAFHLVTALKALSDSREQAFEIIRRYAAEVTAEDISEATIIFMADVPEFRAELIPLLKEKILAGTGLGLFLGPEVSTEFYNTKLFDPLTPADSLLPLKIHGPFVDEEQASRLFALSQFRWNHKVLAGLHDPVLGDLGKARVSSFQDIELVDGVSADILATFVVTGATEEDRSVFPAIVDRPYGAGRILVFNMTANDRWGDLPRRKSYVPLIDRVLDYLADGGERLIFKVGEPVTLSLSPVSPSDTVEIIGPDEIRIRPERQEAGARTLCRVGLLWRAGVYHVFRNGEPELSFVLQPGRGDSDLRSMDPVVLDRLWAASDFERITPSAVTRGNAKDQRRNLAHWVVGVCTLLLLVEMYLVHRLCPRMNPRIAEPVPRWHIGKAGDAEKSANGRSSRVGEEVAAG
jgi:hypothetical protein